MGQCVHMPGQAEGPAHARVARYAMAKKHGWAWIFIGDQALADPNRIPDFHWNGDPALAPTGEIKYVRRH